MLALTIFVPKCNDMAAFFTGTFLGRHEDDAATEPEEDVGGIRGRHDRWNAGCGDRLVSSSRSFSAAACWKPSRSGW